MNLYSPPYAQPYPVGPEQVPPTPRRVETTRGAWCVRCAALVFLTVGPNVVLLGGYLAGANLRALDQTGVRLTTRVEYLWKDPGPRNSRNYWCSYLLRVNGKRVVRQTAVSWEEFRGLREGDPIVITYLPTNPGLCCLGPPGPRLLWHNEITRYLAALVAFIAGSVLIRCEWTIRREIRLATHGLPALGLIISNGTQPGPMSRSFWASYAFPAPNGRLATSWNHVPRAVWDRLPCGTSVTIFYDPDRPWSHMPWYAFRYVRVLRGRSAATPEQVPAESIGGRRRA